MADSERPAPDQPIQPEAATGWTLAFLAPLLSLLVVQPWVPSAFPVWDFAEMLPLLRGTDSVLAGWRVLADFTAIDGRANYLTYLQIVLTWRIAGDDPLLWQWQRATMMIGMGIMVVLTVRRCGGTSPAAAAAALVMLLGVSGADGWVLLMGEPLVVILLCSIIITGQSMPAQAVGGWRVGGIALGAAGVILTKEIAILLIPFALALGLFWNPMHGFSSHRPARDLWRIGAAVTLACFLASLPFLFALAAAGTSGYTSSYTLSAEGLARFPSLMQTMTFPAMYYRAHWKTVFYPANLVWLVAMTLGLVLMVSKSRSAGQRLLLAALLLSIPATGAVIYGFWPRYSPFYGIPFLTGGAGLLAATLSATQRQLRLGWLMAWAFTITIACYSGIIAYRIVNERRAFANLAHSAAHALSADTTADSILVIKPTRGANRWPIRAAELARYAVAIGIQPSTMPQLIDASCEIAAARLREAAGRTGFLNDQNSCGSLPISTVRLVAIARSIDWVEWTASDDSLTIQLLFPDPELPPDAPEVTSPDTAAGSATVPTGP